MQIGGSQIQYTPAQPQKEALASSASNSSQRQGGTESPLDVLDTLLNASTVTAIEEGNKGLSSVLNEVYDRLIDLNEKLEETVKLTEPKTEDDLIVNELTEIEDDDKVESTVVQTSEEVEELIDPEKEAAIAVMDNIRGEEVAAFTRYLDSVRGDENYDARYDLDHDGDVDGKDLAKFSKEQKSDKSLVKESIKRNFGTTKDEQGEDFATHLDLNNDGTINFLDLGLAKDFAHIAKHDNKKDKGKDKDDKKIKNDGPKVNENGNHSIKDSIPVDNVSIEDSELTISTIRDEELGFFGRSFGATTESGNYNKLYDLDDDGDVDGKDLAKFSKEQKSDKSLVKEAIKRNFGTSREEQGENFAAHLDLNNDGYINFQDLGLSKELLKNAESEIKSNNDSVRVVQPEINIVETTIPKTEFTVKGLQEKEEIAFKLHADSREGDSNYDARYDLDGDGDVDKKDKKKFSKAQKSDKKSIRGAIHRHFGTSIKELGASFASHVDLNNDGKINFLDLSLSNELIG